MLATHPRCPVQRMRSRVCTYQATSHKASTQAMSARLTSRAAVCIEVTSLPQNFFEPGCSQTVVHAGLHWLTHTTDPPLFPFSLLLT